MYLWQHTCVCGSLGCNRACGTTPHTHSHTHTRHSDTLVRTHTCMVVRSHASTHARTRARMRTIRCNADGTFTLIIAEVACGSVADLGDDIDKTLRARSHNDRWTIWQWCHCNNVDNVDTDDCGGTLLIFRFVEVHFGYHFWERKYCLFSEIPESGARRSTLCFVPLVVSWIDIQNTYLTFRFPHFDLEAHASKMKFWGPKVVCPAVCWDE